jgi:hypothetical protein
MQIPAANRGLLFDVVARPVPFPRRKASFLTRTIPLMRTASSVFFGLLCSVVILGCGGSNADGPPRFAIKGKVTFDGAPVGDAAPADDEDEQTGGAMISFVRQGGAGGTRLRIAKGEYSAPATAGLEAGTYRVEINWMKPTGKTLTDPDSGEKRPEMINAIPEKYNKKSTLTAEVSSGKSQFDFELAK